MASSRIRAHLVATGTLLAVLGAAPAGAEKPTGSMEETRAEEGKGVEGPKAGTPRPPKAVERRRLGESALPQPKGPDDDCPDPAAERIEFSVLRRNNGQGIVEIRGTVRNVGGASYESSPGQQSAQLYEEWGRGPELVSQREFVNLAPGAAVQVRYERRWTFLDPADLELLPTYRLLIAYDPDIYADGNPRNDDCNTGNNQRTRLGNIR